MPTGHSTPTRHPRETNQMPNGKPNGENRLPPELKTQLNLSNDNDYHPPNHSSDPGQKTLPKLGNPAQIPAQFLLSWRWGRCGGRVGGLAWVAHNDGNRRHSETWITPQWRPYPNCATTRLGLERHPRWGAGSPHSRPRSGFDTFRGKTARGAGPILGRAGRLPLYRVLPACPKGGSSQGGVVSLRDPSRLPPEARLPGQNAQQLPLVTLRGGTSDRNQLIGVSQCHIQSASRAGAYIARQRCIRVYAIVVSSDVHRGSDRHNGALTPAFAAVNGRAKSTDGHRRLVLRAKRGSRGRLSRISAVSGLSCHARDWNSAPSGVIASCIFSLGDMVVRSWRPDGNSLPRCWPTFSAFPKRGQRWSSGSSSGRTLHPTGHGARGWSNGSCEGKRRAPIGLRAVGPYRVAGETAPVAADGRVRGASRPPPGLVPHVPPRAQLRQRTGCEGERMRPRPDRQSIPPVRRLGAALGGRSGWGAGRFSDRRPMRG